MRLQRGRTMLAVVAALATAACFITDSAEARSRQRNVHQWQGWQTSAPNHWNAAAFWQWRAGLLP
jgi:hypothetical protein